MPPEPMLPGLPTRPFVIVGAGGHGREVLDIVDALRCRGLFLGFVDHAAPQGEAASRLIARNAAVVGDLAWLAGSGHDHVIAIGTSAVRRRIDAVLASSTGSAPVLVHPTASIGSEVRLGPGAVVGANSTVTTNVTIGRHTHVNVGCSVQHDTTLGDYVTVSPGVFLNGDVHIGDDVFLGTGAIVTRGCAVGAGATVGAGAVVLNDVPPGTRVMGIPAR